MRGRFLTSRHKLMYRDRPGRWSQFGLGLLAC